MRTAAPHRSQRCAPRTLRWCATPVITTLKSLHKLHTLVYSRAYSVVEIRYATNFFFLTDPPLLPHMIISIYHTLNLRPRLIRQEAYIELLIIIWLR